MRIPFIGAVLLSLCFFCPQPGAAQQSIANLSLDGTWQIGIDRHYTSSAQVPGLPQDPAKPSPGTLWYRRDVVLPAGAWTNATLTLNGARFHPEVYVNGEPEGSSEGGMAPIVFALHGKAIAPGQSVTIEVALRSQKDMPVSDASTVPGADLWRTDISSGLWDDVTLHFSGPSRIVSSIPWTDFARRTVSTHYQLAGAHNSARITAAVLDDKGTAMTEATVSASADAGIVTISLPPSITPWTPDHPQLYRLRLTLIDGASTPDTVEQTWALKHFESRDRRFYLNGEPIEMLGATVVWHRFLRTPGAADVAFDVEWFRKNITQRLKSYGANTLRWHLGLPPERLLDLCDREGLMVQLEWPFFHGVSASVPSMQNQWAAWLNVAMRHPSVMIVHPWNEVGGLAANGWQALNAILPNYPPLVVAHRDTVHIHKYWWSLFENLGLYYDDVAQFDKTAMVDEFGGNYLDLNGDPGGYPSTRESFLRFLGRNATRDDRLEFHAESNARVAEYWRRIGAPGILPFCALGGPQDGSSWFLGDIHHPQPMPVWDALAAAFSPVSVSLDVWDRNYTPGQKLQVPLFLFNDSSQSRSLNVEVRVVDPATHAVLSKQTLIQVLAAHQHAHSFVSVTLPSTTGNLRLEAVLLNPPANLQHPVASAWDVRTLEPKAPAGLSATRIAISADEHELREFLTQNHLQPTTLDDPAAGLIVASTATWEALKKSSSLRATFSTALSRGVSVVLMDMGPHDLGEGYRAKSLGSLEGAPVVRDPYVENVALFHGVRLTFRQLAEPESHIQPAAEDRSLWQGLPLQATWIWNGLRGGLIAPAADMEVSGLSKAALLAQWTQHGADGAAMSSGGSYFAYEFFGYYAFSSLPNDQPTQNALRDRVRLLAEDAPALKDSINPNGPIQQIDLAAALRDSGGDGAQTLTSLSNCGKNLTRSEIVKLSFGPRDGRLILSQVLTAGRLARRSSPLGGYEIRYDPAAEQFALNLMASALQPQER